MNLTSYEAWLVALATLLLGLVILVKGGNKIIDGSVFVARYYGLSPLVIGFTILAFGTSLPEMIVSIFANLQGSPGIALGNVIGSNTANILFVLAATSLCAQVNARVGKPMARDFAMMIFATLLLAWFMSYGGITRIVGGGMLAILMVYVFYQYKLSIAEQKAKAVIEAEEELEVQEFGSAKAAMGVLFLGFIAIAVGAELLVQGAKLSAELMGIPDAIIALSVVALGTSLPELSTSIIAARKGQGEMVIGNIVGSNVFNILSIIGVAALIKPIPTGSFPAQMVTFDIWVAFAAALALILALVAFAKIGRVTAGLFILCYLVYNIYIYGLNMGVI